ncbi:MAG: hypothetical protein ACOC4G_11975 [Bacillota bacterium]
MFERYLGIFFMGIVIKLMDDYLDQDFDKLKDENIINYSIKLKKGILPYSLLLFVFALYLNFEETLSLFLASYVIGMVYDLKQRLPSYLYGWQESLVVLFLCIIMTSLSITISSLILVIMLQLIDDYIDYYKDLEVNEENYIKKLGYIPGITVIVILGLISLKFFSLRFLYFFTAVINLYLLDYILIIIDQKKGL